MVRFVYIKISGKETILMNRNIEISIIIFSDEGREINFRDLKSGKCCIEEKEMTPYFFWGATGGFELVVDGYKTIFKSFEFYVALEAVRFLLNSLYWINGDSKGYDKDEEFPEALVYRFPSHNFIKLMRTGDETFNFSYQSALSTIKYIRGNRFFNEEPFLLKDWAEAVKISLNEYFDVLKPILRDNKENKHSKILTNYLLSEWENIGN